MSDQGLYEPTERHLRRLREQGRGPHSGAARGAAVVAVAAGATWAGWRVVAGALAKGLAVVGGVTAMSRPAAALAAAGGEAKMWAAVLAGLALAMALAAWAVDAMVAGVASERRSLVARGLAGLAAAPAWARGVAVEVAALGVAGVWVWRATEAAAGGEPRLALAVIVPSALGALAVITVGMAAADAALAWAGFTAGARMTRAQVVEERRETGPPPAVASRRLGRLRRRRRQR